MRTPPLRRYAAFCPSASSSACARVGQPAGKKFPLAVGLHFRRAFVIGGFTVTPTASMRS
jgi:hypothetical protein